MYRTQKGDELNCINLLKNRNLHNHLLDMQEAGLVEDGRKEYGKT